VSAERAGNDGAPDLRGRRRYPEAAEKRRERHLPRVPAVARRGACCRAIAVEIVAPGCLGQIRSEDGRAIRTDERTKARRERRHGVAARGLELHEMDC